MQPVRATSISKPDMYNNFIVPQIGAERKQLGEGEEGEGVYEYAWEKKKKISSKSSSDQLRHQCDKIVLISGDA